MINNVIFKFEEYPEKTLHSLFEDAVKKTPNNIAIICEDRIMNYIELNRLANFIGEYFMNTQTIEKGDFIALFMEKNELTIATILGLWKIGVAYIPIDTDPKNTTKDLFRLPFKDSNGSKVLTNEKLKSRVIEAIGTEYEIYIIEEIIKQYKFENINYEISNLELEITIDDLVYVSYTSGTTGVPKGIKKKHRGLVNSITDLSTRYGMNNGEENHVVVLFSSYIFEPFVRQFLIALINSHKLAIIDDQSKLVPSKFVDFC